MVKGQKAKSRYVFAELCIGKDSKKYIEIFKKITKGKFVIPSIQAGIFGFGWLIYRRASKIGFIPYIASVVGLYILVKDMNSISVLLKTFIIFGPSHILFFFFGNFIYWYSVRKKVDNCREDYGDSSSMICLTEIGGTLKGATLVASIMLLQILPVLIVYGLLSADAFFANLWQSITELAQM